MKVSRSIKELSIKINAVRDDLQKRTGMQPTVNQIAEVLSVRPEQVAEALTAALPVLSLTPAGDDDGSPQFDVPVAGEEEHIAESLSLRAAIVTLPEQDRLLLRYRFYENKTQSEAAKLLNTTQVQISRRERKLLALLRKKLTE